MHKRVASRAGKKLSTHRGYQKAKQLLKEHFGNAYRISCAYIEKALSWPSIKSEDPKALQAFALFLRSCCNGMEDLDFMEELDTVSNMRTIALKLPYKLRERWRTRAFELQERRSNNKVKMVDLVNFIEKQANIVSDPVFGDIQDSTPSKGKQKVLVKPTPKDIFATNVSLPQTESRDSQPALCLYCFNRHELMSCLQFEKQPHREKR